MKVSLHINGKLVIRLEPENEIEALIVSKMRVASDKGQAFEISSNADGAIEVAVSQ